MSARLSRRAMVAGALAASAALARQGAAQPSRAVPVIGYLRRTSAIASELAALRAGLESLGYQDGRNIRIEARHANGQIATLRADAKELARLNIDVLVVDGAVTVEIARAAMPAVPIIFALVSDAPRLGIVSLARPGGNMSGLLTFHADLYGKRLELLRELLPGLRRVTIFSNPQNVSETAMEEIAQTSRLLAIETRGFTAASAADWPRMVEDARLWQADAALQLGDATFASRPGEIVALTRRIGLPVIYTEREFVEAGGLAAYGVSMADQWRRSAHYVDKVLRGTRAGDIPVEQPSRVELILNGRTARELGIILPEPLLARADEVIE